MKTLRKIEKSELFGIMVPFGPESGTELFDDCPLCLELNRAMERVEVEEVPIHVEISNAE